MAATDDLINKGVILRQWSGEPGRTFVVTGLLRSGTSLVSSILKRAGVFMGEQINDVVYEDEEISAALSAQDSVALERIIARRNSEHSSWGFKFPNLWDALEASQLSLFDRPHLIITFRDPVAMAVRSSLSEYQDPMQAFQTVMSNLSALATFIERVQCPYLLLSYEKALLFPRDFIDGIARFCNLSIDDTMHGELQREIEPNRPRYLASARRQFDGFVEGIWGGGLYGWCCLTRSPEPVALELLIDDRVALKFPADRFRQDLLDAGFGKGCHGFFINLATLQVQPDSVMRVRVSVHGIELQNSGKRLRDYGTSVDA
jgi:hypothetical protein